MAVSDQVQDLYRTAADVRASFGDDRSSALAYYSPLLDFVTGLRPPDSAPGATRLLDVGCGMGWSTFAFADRGYTATGIDMNAEAFEAPPRDGCAFGVGSATEIPFEAGTFDLVVCYQWGVGPRLTRIRRPFAAGKGRRCRPGSHRSGRPMRPDSTRGRIAGSGLPSGKSGSLVRHRCSTASPTA